jgi:hypothetical protein
MLYSHPYSFLLITINPLKLSHIYDPLRSNFEFIGLNIENFQIEYKYLFLFVCLLHFQYAWYNVHHNISGCQPFPFTSTNHIGGVMGSILSSTVVHHRLKPCSGQTKHYKIGICRFVQNQDNVL